MSSHSHNITRIFIFRMSHSQEITSVLLSSHSQEITKISMFRVIHSKKITKINVSLLE